jgi:hypothetical protein
VRITAGAFADGMPRRDLLLSPHHAVMVGAQLFEAGSLVNGATILREMAAKSVTYHHIELEEHDIMLAEGMPAESFLNTGNRHMFAHTSDGSTVTALRPDFRTHGDDGFCLPMIRGGADLTAARAALLARAAGLGFVITDELALQARVNGRRLRATRLNGDICFMLPAGARTVELHAPAAGASDTSAVLGDQRLLGVALTAVTLTAGRAVTAIDLTDPAHTGLYEPADQAVWTNGAATLALPPFAGAALLTVRTATAVPRFALTATAADERFIISA